MQYSNTIQEEENVTKLADIHDNRGETVDSPECCNNQKGK